MPIEAPHESANLNRTDGTTSGVRLSQSKQRIFEQLIRAETVNSPRQSIITPRPKDAVIPLSFPQLQVWLHAQTNPEVPFYNENITFYRNGPLVPAILEKCLCEIIGVTRSGEQPSTFVIGSRFRLLIPPLPSSRLKSSI